MKGETTMEKITKDELMKKMKLTKEDLEKVAGGAFAECKAECDEKEIQEMNSCDRVFPDEESRTKCIEAAFKCHRNCVLACE